MGEVQTPQHDRVTGSLASPDPFRVGVVDNNELVQGFQQVLLGELSAQEYLDNWADSMTELKKEYDDYLEYMSENKN